MTELCEVYSDLRPKDNAVDNPVVGMFCAAKFPGMSFLFLAAKFKNKNYCANHM